MGILLALIVVQNIQLKHQLSIIAVNVPFNIDSARRDYLKAIHYYFMQGCYRGSDYSMATDTNVGDYCAKEHRGYEETIGNDLDLFAKPKSEYESLGP